MLTNETENTFTATFNDIFQDKEIYGDSTFWANWMAQLTDKTCKYCSEHHGTIVDITVLENKAEVNAHPHCKCVYVPMRTLKAGKATDKGLDGADAQLYYFGKLPDYYVKKKQAEKYGWKNWKGNLKEILPNKMIGGDIYYNRDGKLPKSPKRIWYEADINYSGGYRNNQRVLYSNDGLIFVTYDHYKTFYEITQ